MTKPKASAATRQRRPRNSRALRAKAAGTNRRSAIAAAVVTPINGSSTTSRTVTDTPSTVTAGGDSQRPTSGVIRPGQLKARLTHRAAHTPRASGAVGQRLPAGAPLQHLQRHRGHERGHGRAEDETDRRLQHGHFERDALALRRGDVHLPPRQSDRHTRRDAKHQHAEQKHQPSARQYPAGVGEQPAEPEPGGGIGGEARPCANALNASAVVCHARLDPAPGA